MTAHRPPMFALFGPAERLRRLAACVDRGESVQPSDVLTELEHLVDAADRLRSNPQTARLFDAAAEERMPS